jgi:hypothetical protein
MRVPWKRMLCEPLPFSPTKVAPVVEHLPAAVDGADDADRRRHGAAAEVAAREDRVLRGLRPA